MQLNYDQFVNIYFPIKPTINQKGSSSSISVSKQGQMIKEQTFTENEWKSWREHFVQEIELQNILNECKPNSFLKIQNWVEEFQKQMYRVWIIYENMSNCQNLELYIKNNTISQEKQINIIYQILLIGIELQRRKIFHLNITPKNLIYVNGFIKLTDFGSSRVIHNYYYSQKCSEEQKHQYHFYQSASMLKIKMMDNFDEQDLSFQEIVQDELLQNSIFQKNDEWSLSLIICQIITKQFDIKIKNYEDFFSFNSYRIKELLKQVRNQFPQLYIFCNKLIEQRLGLNVAYNTLIEITSSFKTSVSKIKPLIMRLDPLNDNTERKSTAQRIAVTNNYYYVSIAEIKMKEKEQVDYQMNSNNILTTAPNNSKKSIDDEKLDKMQFLHSSDNLNDNQFTFFLKDPSNVIMLNQNQLKEMHLNEKTKYEKIQHVNCIRDNQFSLEKNQYQEISMQQSYINQNNIQDSFLNNKANQLNLATIIKLFWDEEFMQNDVLKQFFNESQIHMDYELKLNHSLSHLINYKSQILKISNKQFIYQGYQKDNLPHGIGIKYIKQKNWKLIFGIFESSIILQCIMIELNNKGQIQIFQGKLNDDQTKEGESVLEWFKIVNQHFIKQQKHIGLISKNKIIGYGVRTYYNNSNHQLFNYVYQGNFENSQKQGKGKLYKEQQSNLELIFDGEFNQDQYCGIGLAYFNKDLIMQARFSKGKIIQCQNLKYKEKSVTVY
ncbi:unnamed protein product [Paramecium octaurelia]|uniref:Protein kinase domain-containing protein n=1 Tax=Paramecium octaurelia TaxID=43137 RepID=A0A8S1SH61_PAROT|nr:unnamed protein product [Paramecium octaurelia]